MLGAHDALAQILRADERHDGHAGLKPGQTQRQFGEDHEGEQGDHRRVGAALRQRVSPVGKHLRVVGDVHARGHEHHERQRDEGAHQHRGHGHRLAEAAEENRGKRRNERQGDGQLPRRVRGAEKVRGGVRRGQRHRDDEVRHGEAEQNEHDEFAAPPGDEAFQEGNGSQPVRGAGGDVPVDGHDAQKGDGDQDERGDGRQRPGRRDGDAGLVAEGREIVHAGQAHDLRPGVLLRGAPPLRGEVIPPQWLRACQRRIAIHPRESTPLLANRKSHLLERFEIRITALCQRTAQAAHQV